MANSSLKRILMAEDEPDIRLIAQMALETVGEFQVRVCCSGGEALQAAPSFRPDLIILDVMMPGMDGLSALREFRALTAFAATPIVLMTARVQPHELAQYRRLGAFDVIVKPFDAMQLSARIAAIWQRHLAVALDLEIRALTAEYLEELPATLSQLEQAWHAARQVEDEAGIRHVQRLAHTLRGSVATLGLRELSDVARTLDIALASARVPAQIDQLLLAVRNAAAASIATFNQSSEPGAVTEPLTRAWSIVRSSSNGSPPKSRAVALAEIDPTLALALATQFGNFGYSVFTAATLDDLEPEIERLEPVAIITDASSLSASAGRDDQLLSFRRIGTQPPAIVVLADDGQLDTRLRAVRAGSDAFFTKPVNTSALLDKIDQFGAQHTAEPCRILIVDDELAAANTHAALLQAAGMLTVVVTDPLRVMQPLIEFRPDMILMDMYMPGCDGMTLAAVIRQQEDYVGIPIVFLSAETNRDMQLAAIQLGADDFMAKPVQPDYLISAVLSRIQRSRSLRSLMIRDSLTGLFNHTATKERLETEIVRANRDRQQLSFALLDIDHFKQVNDTYGHPTGDWVLKSLARLLLQRLRRSDIIGRYGGEEFAVVLPGTPGDDAARVLDEIRAGLSRMPQHFGDREFTVTFSCGIASFPTHQEAARLTVAADQALYAAKHGGRNRVVLASD